MSDPAETLRAALDAAQKVAEAAAAVCGCHPPVPSWTFGDETTKGRILIVDDPHPTLHRKMGRRWNGSYEGMFTAQHIVLNDPAAVLRRIAADREILEDAENIISGWNEDHVKDFAQDVIRNLATGWGWNADA